MDCGHVIVTLVILMGQFYTHTDNCILLDYHLEDYRYTVFQKTSHLWLAITLMHMNGF